MKKISKEKKRRIQKIQELRAFPIGIIIIAILLLFLVPVTDGSGKEWRAIPLNNTCNTLNIDYPSGSPCGKANTMVWIGTALAIIGVLGALAVEKEVNDARFEE